MKSYYVITTTVAGKTYYVSDDAHRKDFTLLQRRAMRLPTHSKAAGSVRVIKMIYENLDLEIIKCKEE